MARRYKHTANATTTLTLLAKNEGGSAIKNMLITNIHDTVNSTIELYTDTGIAGNATDYNYLLKTVIPAKCSLLVDNSILSFNTKGYSLKSKATLGEIHITIN